MLKRNVILITKQTKAIVTEESAYYRSIVLEGNKKHPSIHTAEKILDYSCTLFGASLAGRRKSIKTAFQITHKIPVPVNPQQGVYMMPTSSTKSRECVWLAYYHIDYYEQRGEKTYVTFMDGSGLFVDASVSSIDMQHKRASQIIAKQHRMTLFGPHSVDPFNRRRSLH